MAADPGPPRPNDIDHFIDDVLASGGSESGSTNPGGSDPGFDWGWLIIPALALMLRQGLLRGALALSYALAPLVAAVLVLLDWWSARRERR